MNSSIPFIGAKRSLYECNIFDTATLRCLGRHTAMEYLNNLSVGSWIVRHSSFQNLLINHQVEFTTSFQEKIKAFFAISVRNVRKINHYLIVQVDNNSCSPQDGHYYYLKVKQNRHLVAMHKTPLVVKDLLDFMGLSTQQQQKELINMKTRDYINF
jgi:hypothetical protein